MRKKASQNKIQKTHRKKEATQNIDKPFRDEDEKSALTQAQAQLMKNDVTENSEAAGLKVTNLDTGSGSDHLQKSKRGVSTPIIEKEDEESVIGQTQAQLMKNDVTNTPDC